MASSFISERTAELITIPALLKSLKPYYPKITPLFYWISREGGKMSRGSFADIPVKLLALYSRRPKVDQPGAGFIDIKLNEILFDRTRQFSSKGIPVIAGFPLVDKLEDLQIDAACMWIKINPEGSEAVLSVSINERYISPAGTEILDAGQIAELIGQSRSFSWSEAMDQINEVRRQPIAEGRYSFYLSGDLYKPVYLVIHSPVNLSFH